MRFCYNTRTSFRRYSVVVAQRFCKPLVGGPNPSAGSSWWMRLALAAAISLSAGCATSVFTEHREPAPVEFKTARLPMTPPVEALLAYKGLKVQTLGGAYRNEAFQADCVIKGDGKRFTAVILTPVSRLLTVEILPPHTVRCEYAPQLPKAFQGEYVLADLAFINLPLAELQSCIAPALRAEEQGGVRRILTAAGTPIAEVLSRSDGTKAYRNLVFGYEYVVKDVQ